VDFTLDDVQREIADLASVVLRKELDPDRAWRALADSGLLALALPPELGGDGLGVAEVALVLTEVGRAAAPVPALAALALGVLPVNRLGSARQRAALLPGIAAGHELVTAALHEPSAPLVRRPSTTAVAVDGSWSLSGTKTGVPYAKTATKILVPASVLGGTCVFLVDPHAAGVTLTSTRNSSGSPECTMGLAGVRVEEADLLEDRQSGEAIVTLHRFALAGAAALADGTLAGALALTTRHIGTREQFGKPLARFQAVAQEIADVYVASRTLHLAAMSAVWRLSAGLDADSDLDIAAFWLAVEAPRALAACHHLHGGLGVDVTYPLHRHYAAIKDLGRFVGGAASRLSKLGELVAG
jgi:alkylation response protein AidB-like acyl-CoA dehydrogenase